MKFINEFNIYIKDSYERVMGNAEFPEIKYSYLDEGAETNIEQLFNKQINLRREDELRRAANLSGPHRDDFVFLINDMNLKVMAHRASTKHFKPLFVLHSFFI